MVKAGEYSKPKGVVWGFPGGSVGKESACSVGDLASIPGLGRSPEEGHTPCHVRTRTYTHTCTHTRTHTVLTALRCKPVVKNYIRTVAWILEKRIYFKLFFRVSSFFFFYYSSEVWRELMISNTRNLRNY